MHFIKRNRLEKHPQAELQVNEEETPTLHSSTQRNIRLDHLSCSSSYSSAPSSNLIVWLVSSFAPLTCTARCVQSNLPWGGQSESFPLHTDTQITNKPVDSHLALAGGTATFWRPPPPIWGCPEPAGTTAAVWGRRSWSPTCCPLMTHITWKEKQEWTRLLHLLWALIGDSGQSQIFSNMIRGAV